MSVPVASSDAAAAALSALGAYKNLRLSWAAPGVLNVHLQYGKLNTMTQLFWREMRECFAAIGQSVEVRCVLITAEGKLFTAGIDLAVRTQHKGTHARTTGVRDDNISRMLTLVLCLHIVSLFVFRTTPTVS